MPRFRTQRARGIGVFMELSGFNTSAACFMRFCSEKGRVNLRNSHGFAG